MRPTKKVFLFVIISVSIYCIFSVFLLYYKHNILSFNKVNLVSDVVVNNSPAIATTKMDSVVSNKPKAGEDSINIATYDRNNFTSYEYPKYITAFQTDTSLPSLSRLDAKLLALKQGKKVKVRIAYMGDSMIEGDRVTQTLRKLFQQEFGGSGVGFMVVSSKVGTFRTTVSAEFSDNWRDDNLKSGSPLAKKTLFISGHTFYGNNSWTKITDRSSKDSVPLQKILFCGRYNGKGTINYNELPFSFDAPNYFNRILLSEDYSKSTKISVSDNALPVYGISFETDSGVILDNFSFRGVSGFELNAFDPNFLKSIAQNNNYDLIIFGYGVNVLFRPNDTDFKWYQKMFDPVLKKFKEGFPNSDMIVVSTADRAFRYDGNYASAAGIDSLVSIQAKLALNNGICFYNEFASMGGANTVVNWANQLPPLANKDYIHPTLKGSEILAGNFYNAIFNDYKKYTQQPAAAKTN